MRHITTILLGAVALSLANAPGAFAADMPTKAPMVAPYYNWSGWYAGVNAGYAVAQNSTVLTGGIFGSNESFGVDPAGVLGGFQLGANWQFNKLVVGVEADLQATGQKSTACVDRCVVGVTSVVEQKLPWFGTARARLGYADGTMLYYVTGGLAYGRVNSTINIRDIEMHSFSATKAGFVLGGGVEAAIAGQWTVKAEYLYINLGHQAETFTSFGVLPYSYSVDIKEHVFRFGLNYHFSDPGMRAMAAAPGAPVRAPLHNWTGFYAGANGGYAVARNPTSYTSVGFQPNMESIDLDPHGIVGGVGLGFNWQSNKLVLGIETDIQASAAKSSDNCIFVCPSPLLVNSPALSITEKMSRFGTLRGRIGYANGPALFYATGGLAYARVNLHTEYQNNGAGFSTLLNTSDVSKTNVGWTVGGGIEAAIAGNWSAKAEYLYMDLGSISASFPIIFGGPFAPNVNTISSDIREHVFRVGLNYSL
jgi:outer membrane immunogenic protein